MTWTRMNDELGGYFSVSVCYGQKTGARVYQRNGQWVLSLDGRHVGEYRTCREAKSVAVIEVHRWRGQVSQVQGV